MVKCSCVDSKVPGSNSTELFIPSFFFFPFFVLLFSINIYLNNCYLIKRNKKQEKYHVSREKIVHLILNNFMDKQSEFPSFPTIYCGKTEDDNHLIIF